ncbi:MAG: TIGR03915 family putative DNA repair protein [Christensenellales bacterium]|jgi:probable DNA metabolism protein
MPNFRIRVTPGEIVYHYDGGLAGFFCCVHACVYSKTMPLAILPEGEAQPCLMPVQVIQTNGETACRVRDSVNEHIGARALELVETVFLSCMREKEMALLRFLIKGYREGKRAAYMLGHPEVAPLLDAERHLLRERQLLLGFVRFTEYDGALVSIITPKNFILPLIARHFIMRYSCENFMIYDQTHQAALIYYDRKKRIVPLQALELPVVSEKEEQYQTLWKRFYEQIAISARENPKCRMSHMPKRYWEHMPEVRDLLHKQPGQTQKSEQTGRLFLP